MLQTVLPYQIFALIEEPANNRAINIKLPELRDLTVLQTCLLIAAIKHVKARRIFEFGTFFGSTTLNIAMNTGPDAEVFTLDLSREDLCGLEQHPDDAAITQDHFARQSLDFERSAFAGKIRTLTGNSRTIDLSEYFGSMDFVFIDGGHDLETVRADTENALTMIRRGGCIAWHDYNNPPYPDLTEYLNGLEIANEMCAVGGTMLAFWFPGRKMPWQS